MAVYKHVNTADETTLNGGITDVATSLTMTSGTGYPTSDFKILIATEAITVGTRTGNSCTSLVRGDDGTTAAAHSDTDAINHVVTAEDIEPKFDRATSKYAFSAAFGIIDGTAGAPAVFLLSDIDTGLVDVVDGLGISAGGTLRFAATTSEIQARGDNGAHFYDYAPATTAGGGSDARFVNATGAIYSIQRDTTSSVTLKKLISPLTGRGRVAPVRFRYKAGVADDDPQGDMWQIGYTVEDVTTVHPEAIIKNAADESYDIHYKKLDAGITAGIYDELDALELRLVTLEGK